MTLKVEIDNDSLTDAIGHSVAKSLEKGIESFQVKSQVSEAVEKAVVDSDMAQKIYNEIKKRLDEEAEVLVREAVDEIMPGFKIAFSRAFKGSLVAMVYGLRNGKPSYMGTEDVRRWKETEEELS